ncbi:MAG: M20 family metallopeptidase [Candidatus Bipolaricaulota bacterium]|nr:M20 family metallopeptidase [Candidatus Bipolaricaulota bacterium]
MLKIDARVQKETVELLKTLVGIKSANPPGSEDEIANFAKSFLAKNGIEATLLPLEEGRSSVVARIPGSEPGSIVLCAHLDTVNADEEKWTVPAFEPQIVDGRMTGLGSADMKSGLATILEIAKLIVEKDLPLKKSLVLVLTADEEKAYRGAASVAKSGLIDDAEFLVIPEPTAGKAYIGQKGELWVEAVFEGKAAHGAMPEQGINTILPASEFCLALAEEAKGFPEVVGRGRTSLNIGQIDGGWQVNIVPDTTRVRIDSRVVSDADKEMVLNLVKQLGEDAATHVGARFSYKIFNYKPPIISDENNPYISGFLAAVAGSDQALYNVEIAPYSTDAVSIIPKLKIPVVIYGPGDIAQAHQPDEYLELSSLYEALDLFARFLNSMVIEQNG